MGGTRWLVPAWRRVRGRWWFWTATAAAITALTAGAVAASATSSRPVRVTHVTDPPTTTSVPPTTMPPTTTLPPATTTTAPRPVTTVPPTTAPPAAAPSPAAVPSGAPYFTFTADVTEGGSGTGYSAYVNAHDASGNAISVGIQSDQTDPHSRGNPWYTWERVQNGAFSYGYIAPAAAGSNAVALSWWGSDVAVFSVNGSPIAQVPVTLVPRLFFSIEGDARVNGDSVNDTFTNAQITVGNQCPTYCGLNGSWNTSSFNTDGLAAHDTNGAPQNGADFTVTGTASAPAGANWDNSVIAGIAMIAQYWNGS